jgi:Sulfotransferase domain
MIPEKSLSDLKILILGTPRTGNTWIKYCLSLIYDLPVVDFPPPEFWRPFDAHPYDQLGRRWIAHQHLPPFESLVHWARNRGVVLITTIRHPADTLVSLYHYVRNFRERTPIDDETISLLTTSSKKGETDNELPAHDDLQAYVREKFFKTLHFSIAWLQRRLSYGIRYEDLWDKPFETIHALTDQISPVLHEHISACLERCRLEQMRKDAQADAVFFRGGGVGNWKTSLPASIVRMLAHLPPYPSQIGWLGYSLDAYTEACEKTESELPTRPPPPPSSLPFILHSFMTPKKIAMAEAYYDWLNSVSEKDSHGAEIPPVITNLGTYIYENRRDLQVAFPDIYGADRVAFSHWFTEINLAGTRVLHSYFLVPVYESWLRGPPLVFEPLQYPR